MEDNNRTETATNARRRHKLVLVQDMIIDYRMQGS